MKRYFYGLVIFIFLALSPRVHGATFNVTPNGGSDCNAGPCNLQSAMDAATFNGQDNLLNLAAGHYGPGTFTYRPLSAVGSLTLMGDSGGGTIIDAGGNPGMAMDTTLLVADSESDIRVQNISFRNGQSSMGGAGLSIQTNDADINVENCDFQSNQSTVTAVSNGSFNIGGGGLSANALSAGSVFLIENHFVNNSAPKSGAGGSLSVSVGGQVVLEGNTYVHNTALFNPNDATSGGGAVAVAVQGDLTVNRNLFLENSVSASGGGLLTVSVSGNGRITNNVIAGNTSSAFNSSVLTGGGGLIMIVVFASVDVTNNTITENRIMNGQGGGLYVVFQSDTAEATISNNIIWGNTASGGIFCSTDCNDLAVEDDFDFNNIGSIFSISHNDFVDFASSCDGINCLSHKNVDVATNLNEDPLFVASSQNDFHLSTGSPLINKGNASASGLPALDFDQKPRVQGPSPDLGAFEFVSTPSTENCANNVDDDGDGKIDCQDPDCSGAGVCQPTPPGSENCANNIDDDKDGKIDCNDPDCAGAVACQNAGPSTGGEICANNIDDDGDGLIDCNDPDCAGACGNNNNPSPPPNISVKGGCSMTVGPGSPFSLLCLFIPLLLLAAKRRMRRF